MNDQHSSNVNRKNKEDKRKLSQSTLKHCIKSTEDERHKRKKLKNDTENFQTK